MSWTRITRKARIFSEFTEFFRSVRGVRVQKNLNFFLEMAMAEDRVSSWAWDRINYNLMMAISALIFDMDGTLGDTLPSILIAMRETFARFTGRICTDDEIVAMFGPSEEGMIRPRVPADSYEPALHYYLGRYAALHADAPFPGIHDLMSYLKERGIRIAVATGKGPGTAAISMHAYGLDKYVDRLETGSPHGAVKPELIQRVLANWKLPADQAGYVGDMQSDMADARMAGVLPLGAAWSGSSSITEADTPYRFTRVESLMTWLASM